MCVNVTHRWSKICVWIHILKCTLCLLYSDSDLHIFHSVATNWSGNTNYFFFALIPESCSKKKSHLQPPIKRTFPVGEQSEIVALWMTFFWSASHVNRRVCATVRSVGISVWRVLKVIFHTIFIDLKGLRWLEGAIITHSSSSLVCTL